MKRMNCKSTFGWPSLLLCVQVIAGVVSRDPVTYNEAYLGKENAEYCKWITSPDKWGGAIELAILATYYGREIAAYDIQTKRCDVYAQDAGDRLCPVACLLLSVVSTMCLLLSVASTMCMLLFACGRVLG